MRSHVLRATALAGTAILLAGGCGDSPTDIETEIQAPLFAKPATPLDWVQLDAYFRSAEHDGVVGDNIDEPYSGALRDNGSLALSTLDDDPDRVICFEFGTQAPSLSDCRDAFLTTADPRFDGDHEGMLQLTVDSTLHTSGQFIWSSVEFEDGKEQPAEWYLRYGSTCELGDNSLYDNRFDVVRTSETTWTFEGDDAVLCRRWVRGRFILEEIGRFSMPFVLELVQKP